MHATSSSLPSSDAAVTDSSGGGRYDTLIKGGIGCEDGPVALGPPVRPDFAVKFRNLYLSENKSNCITVTSLVGYVSPCHRYTKVSHGSEWG